MTARVALVTGAAGGLGRAVARALAAQGCDLVLNDLGPDLLAPVAAEITGLGRRALAVAADVTDPEAVQGMFARAAATLGAPTILVNNAGGNLGTPRNLEELTHPQWRGVVALNLDSVFLCCQGALPAMRAAGWGRIINVASIGGRTASAASGAAYSAAKGGVIALTRRLALDTGAAGITVNAVAPGRLDGGMAGGWSQLSPEQRQQVIGTIPLGRLAAAVEVAAAVAFLASEAAAYVTGAVIDVNGGRFMG